MPGARGGSAHPGRGLLLPSPCRLLDEVGIRKSHREATPARKCGTRCRSRMRTAWAINTPHAREYTQSRHAPKSSAVARAERDLLLRGHLREKFGNFRLDRRTSLRGAARRVWLKLAGRMAERKRAVNCDEGDAVGEMVGAECLFAACRDENVRRCEAKVRKEQGAG